jgi:enolase
MPMVNILSGGAHASLGMDFQDFLAVPVAAQSFSEAMHHIMRVRRSAQQVMTKRGLSALLADEGGLSPCLRSVEAALDLMVEAIEAAGLAPARDVAIAIDVAATNFFTGRLYDLRCEGRRLSGLEVVSMIADLVREYPIVSVEDALDENDWDNWVNLTARVPHIQVVGDDLFTTNSDRILKGIDLAAANAVLIKPNQNGTLSGTLRAMGLARQAGLATIVSARSGETEDSFIADLAVGTSTGQIKIGSVRTSERLSKYNQLLRIEEDTAVSFSGMSGVAWRRNQTTPTEGLGGLLNGPSDNPDEPRNFTPDHV